MDDLPPGSFVTLEVVRLPSTKTFWFSFIPYDMVGGISGGSKWEETEEQKGEVASARSLKIKTLKTFPPGGGAGLIFTCIYRVEFVVLGEITGKGTQSLVRLPFCSS
jgi:hypothetical protein